MAIVPVPSDPAPFGRGREPSGHGRRLLVFLSDVVKYFVSDLFPGHEAVGVWAFRITRNSHLYVDEEEGGESSFIDRGRAPQPEKRSWRVRLEIDEDADEGILNHLLSATGLEEQDACQDRRADQFVRGL